MAGEKGRGGELRRDAQANRAAIIEAAAACFEEDGVSVSMEKIIARAGVGRGTLYRNFESRTELLFATIQAQLDRLEAALDPAMNLEQAIRAIALASGKMSSLYHRVVGDIISLGRDSPAMYGLGARYESILAPALRQSLAAHEVDQATTIQQAAMAARMVGSTVLPNLTEAESLETIDQAVQLVMSGLRPR